jgi:hypothetical protein
MGAWNFGFYAASHAQQLLGWLAPANIQVIQSLRQYAVVAYKTRNAEGMVKALRRSPAYQ